MVDTIAELQEIVGRENVLFDPSKEEFKSMLHDRQKEIIVVELTHTDKGIVLRDNERFDSRDILRGGELSHIKYLLSGLCSCRVSSLERGEFAASLRKKGVGIINASFREISSKDGLKRLK